MTSHPGAATLFAERESAIRQHLFLLCPNNSGSTFLVQALGECAACLSLPREGQHTVGFAGPSSRNTPWPLIWGATAESRAVFSDSASYDWERTRRAWYLQAQSSSASASLFVTKSPPFLLLADDLRSHFPSTRFIVMVRNPYAAIEGILRRWQRSERYSPADLRRVAAEHLLFCLEQQITNAREHADISHQLTYESMCDDPAGTERQLGEFLPELADVDLCRQRAVKGSYNEALRNMNAEQIARLSTADIDAATEVFANRPQVLAHYGYSLL